VLFSCVDPWLLSIITTIIWECNCCEIMADNPPGAPRQFLVTVPELTVSRECRSKKFIPARCSPLTWPDTARGWGTSALADSLVLVSWRSVAGCVVPEVFIVQLVCLLTDVSLGLLGPDDHGFVLPKCRWLETASPPNRIDSSATPLWECLISPLNFFQESL